MERQNCRKGLENRRVQSSPLHVSSIEREVMYNDKNRYKKHTHCDKRKYETNSYFTNWPAQARIQQFGQKSFSTPDSPICHYSVPLSFSFEPVSLPIYSALIQPQGSCSTPIEVSSHSRKTKHHKSCKNKKSKSNMINEVPAIFNTPRVNNGDQQDYTSLPPVNCDIYASKSSDNDTTCRRRFSDPGIGQLSTDDCSTSGSNETESSATPETDSQDFFTLIEQINELKESNSHLRRELQETKLELEFLKVNSQSWRSENEDFKPGILSDAISEIREAVKVSEDALISKATQMVEKTKAECKVMQMKLEERLRQEMDERLLKLLEGIRKHEAKGGLSSEAAGASPAGECAMQQQLVELEQEKLQLTKELQEAVAKRKSAEATTEKLERLVGILRKKINGVSLESCIPEEKQNPVRPLASSLEKNPFIIANNRHGQKPEILSFQKPKLTATKALPSENLEVINLGGNENKENETGGSGNGNEDSSSGHSVPETPSVTAQVTITGPVTDL